jgi:hypothetical protein
MKFFAGLLGVDISASEKEEEESGELKSSAPKKPFVPRADMSSTLFKHPSEYAHLTDEEKQELSERMLGVHRQAMRNSPLGKGIF